MSSCIQRSLRSEGAPVSIQFDENLELGFVRIGGDVERFVLSGTPDELAAWTQALADKVAEWRAVRSKASPWPFTPRPSVPPRRRG